MQRYFYAASKSFYFRYCKSFFYQKQEASVALLSSFLVEHEAMQDY